MYKEASAEYYIAIANIYYDKLLEAILEHLNAFGIHPDVNLIRKLLYNINVDKTVLSILNSRRIKYDKKITSEMLQFIINGDLSSDALKDYLDKLVYDLEKDELMSQGNNVLGIYRTEYTRIRSGVKMYIVDHYERLGYDVEKKWVYTYESTKYRDAHLASDGLKADADGYFMINGKKTLGPGYFGDPSEDINCRCDMSIVVHDRPQ